MITIRPYRPADAPALAALFFASVRQAGLRDYSRAQVEAWAPEPPDPRSFERRAAKRLSFLVATGEADGPVGYIDLEADGHIDHMYLRPEFVGKGVGSQLYDALETAARTHGVYRLYVEASEAARRMFLRKGFQVVARRDFAVRGVAIHNYAMEKDLETP
ncbi:MAG: GNAT family N-acetyltransferase [Phenylobacterium sp.]|uniref:GNAT family N-acetyltransferase n=1 Tax=Phenylobacterium sp. TaxID=1871053 RepID=UPI00273372BE|nr:GNAT family N-acetyltransferase [Phenylobacterium sp.]MDP3174505.1 GNAT family N-acetyltransferase [Phenylobacterium sp.]